jgi:hypothetical protein
MRTRPSKGSVPETSDLSLKEGHVWGSLEIAKEVTFRSLVAFSCPVVSLYGLSVEINDYV